MNGSVVSNSGVASTNVTGGTNGACAPASLSVTYPVPAHVQASQYRNTERLSQTTAPVPRLIN